MEERESKKVLAFPAPTPTRRFWEEGHFTDEQLDAAERHYHEVGYCFDPRWRDDWMLDYPLASGVRFGDSTAADLNREIALNEDISRRAAIRAMFLSRVAVEVARGLAQHGVTE